METGIDTEIEDEEEEDSCKADTKPIPNENKHSSQYYNWSSTGTETEDDGVSQDKDYTPAEEIIEEEYDESEEDFTEDENDIKYVLTVWTYNSVAGNIHFFPYKIPTPPRRIELRLLPITSFFLCSFRIMLDIFFFAELIQAPVISCTMSQNSSCSTRCC